MDSWMVWSLVELMSGRYLDKGPWGETVPSRKGLEGKELAGGWRAVLCAHRGDEKYLAKAYHIGVSWLSQQVCWTCKASRMSTSSLLYTHFGPNAQHRTTFLTTSDFIQLCNPNPWVRLPGWHVDVMTYDLLHVFDLTLVPDAAASVSWLHFIVGVHAMVNARSMHVFRMQWLAHQKKHTLYAGSGGIDTDWWSMGRHDCVYVHAYYVSQGCIACDCFTLIFCAFYSVCLFAGSTVDDRLQTAYAEFTKLCRTHKIRISFCMWTQYDTICAFWWFCLTIYPNHSLSAMFPRKPWAILQVAAGWESVLGYATVCQVFFFSVLVSLSLHKYLSY